MPLRLLYRKACPNKYSVVVKQGKVCLMKTLVLSACINRLIKTLCFLDYLGPGESSLIFEATWESAWCSDAVISLCLRPNHCEGRAPQNIINVLWNHKEQFNQAENGCLRGEMMKGYVQFTGGLTWVDCGHELWVKAWKYCGTIKIPWKERKAKLSDLQSRLLYAVLKGKNSHFCITFDSLSHQCFCFFLTLWILSCTIAIFRIIYLPCLTVNRS